MKRYPKGKITPHGWYHLVKGEKPMMWLTAYDDSMRFDLSGGLAIPDRYEAPEAAHLVGLKGLIPPWKHIQQKGATQDGVTHIDALYDPIEVTADLQCWGRDARHTRTVYRDLIASIDAKQQSLLHFWTHEEGHWWAPIRWFQGAPPEPVAITTHQNVSLRLQADDGFWRTHDHTSVFQFSYADFTEEFGTDYADDAGPDWPLRYNGEGGGHVYTSGGLLRFQDDPDDWTLTETREVVAGPYRDFETETDNQVVSMVFGGLQEWSFPDSGANDLWARMGRDSNGDWDGNGIRLRVQRHWIKLSRFNNFSQTVLFQRPLLVRALPGERFTLVAGYTGNERLFKVFRGKRGQLEILAHKESGTGSELGPDFRGVGWGMQAGGAVITQATPAPIRAVEAGDNAMATQSGFLERVNIGDQPMWDDYTLFGPFSKVKIYDGPGSSEYVEFGPLLDNQIVFLRTDPRSNTTLVQDLTTVPPTPQELNLFQDALSKFLSFAGMNNSALGDQVKSLFGIRPPQGNLYKYLNGRFSDNAAIPAKSPGNGASPYFVKVEIEGGNADSRVIASGTPKRRYPL